jgi:RNA polymerase-interacting CarD/CdnL/TRCF family regulator
MRKRLMRTWLMRTWPMRAGTLLSILALGLAPAVRLRADLKPALAERDLGRRSKLALDNAETVLKAARAAYERGETEKVAAGIQEIVESVDMASESLAKTGKNPRSSPKWFKQAEIQTRDLLKRLETFQRDMSFADRPMLDKAKTRVQEVHDSLLLGLMEGKHK